MDTLIQYGNERKHELYDAAQDRLIRDMGYGATTGGVAITKRCLTPLADYVREQLTATLHGNDNLRHLFRVIQDLSPETIALCILQSAIHSVAIASPHLRTAIYMGRALAVECWAAGLLQHNPTVAKRIERATTRRHGSLKYRRRAARAAAKRAGYAQARWTNEAEVEAGTWMLGCALAALPDIFTLTEGREENGWPQGFLTITEGAQDIVDKAVEFAIQKTRPWLPELTPPTLWDRVSLDREAYPKPVSLVRAHGQEPLGLLRGAIREGTMRPALGALNALQAVPWRINTQVLRVMQECYEQGITVPGVPSKAVIPPPEHPGEWERLTDTQRRVWRTQASKVAEGNLALVADRVLFTESFCIAELLSKEDRFWTPCNVDWRGRVYPLPHFNFQREDRVRALFLFADGVPIGEEGIKWLKVHLANCGDFDKVSKRPFEERVKWVDENLSRIIAVAADPLGTNAPSASTSGPDTGLWWTTADKPFLFLASCMELTAALGEGAKYVTTLPVSWDGSCSGLQHLCAMTRAEEGDLVNLTDAEHPQDIYQTVADRAFSKVEADAAEGNVSAQQFLAFGVSRSLVKRNVMTYSYSSKPYGMAQQHMEDLMRPLSLEVLMGQRDAHPFGEDAGKAAAKYIARVVYNAIEEVVRKPADAMRFLQQCSRALAHEGKPLQWTTPTGLPWVNRYHEPITKRIKLWLHDVMVHALMADGYKKEIDKTAAANGVAPNFVHALDAAHLMLTTNAAVAEGITALATVHDSFGCLAPHSRRFHQIIREQFVQMYEDHDVLAEVLEQAKRDLTVHNWKRLPEVPEKGTLNLRDVHHARYAFA